MFKNIIVLIILTKFDMNKLNNVTLNFNLREPHKKSATQIYAVIRINGKQHKISLGCKIEPWNWDSIRQTPIINGSQSILSIINIISHFKLVFSRNFVNLCNVHQCLTKIKEDINMNNKNLRKSVTRTPKATTLLKRAFDMYYTEKSVKISTKNVTRERLKKYEEYCMTIDEDKMSMLSQDGLNKYRDFLVKERTIKETQGNKRVSCNATINYKCEVIAMLINFMAGHSEFARYNIQPVIYKQLHETKSKSENKMRRPLTEKELKAIAECDTLTPRETEYRDLFLIQCECGCRASDLHRLFDEKEQELYESDGKQITVINTTKENIKAVVVMTPLICDIQNKYKRGFNHVKFSNIISPYNVNLKEIFRKAGLTTVETYTDANGKTQRKPLCEIINSHYARYTFINNCIAKGLTPNEIKDMSGHADETMINEVYAIIRAKDKASNAFKALKRVTVNNIEDCKPGNNITEYRDVLAHYGEPRQNYANLNEEELLRLIVAKYEVPLNQMGWKTKDLKNIYNNETKDMNIHDKFVKDLQKVEAGNGLNR